MPVGRPKGYSPKRDNQKWNYCPNCGKKVN